MQSASRQLPAAASTAAATAPTWELDKGARQYFYALGLRGLTQAYERARTNVRLAFEVNDDLSLEGAQLTHKYLVMAIEDLMQVGFPFGVVVVVVVAAAVYYGHTGAPEFIRSLV